MHGPYTGITYIVTMLLIGFVANIIGGFFIETGAQTLNLKTLRTAHYTHFTLSTFRISRCTLTSETPTQLC